MNADVSASADAAAAAATAAPVSATPPATVDTKREGKKVSRSFVETSPMDKPRRGDRLETT